jgi:3-oxoadipate enol-lactonase
MPWNSLNDKRLFEKRNPEMTEGSVPLAFDRVGHGVPLILLHGYPLNRTIWNRVIPYFQDNTDVISPDLRGHGDSPIPPGEYLMETMAGDVVALMNRLGVERVVIAGHSMGGYVALALLKNFPERISALALVASQAAADSPERYQARMQSIAEIQKSGTGVVTESMLTRLTRNKALYPELKRIFSSATREGLIGTLQGIAKREDARPWLGSITIPVLVISGGEDAIIPREKAAEVVNRCRSAWWMELPDCGHMPMMENPEATGLALRSLVVTTQARLADSNY